MSNLIPILQKISNYNSKYDNYNTYSPTSASSWSTSKDSIPLNCLTAISSDASLNDYISNTGNNPTKVNLYNHLKSLPNCTSGGTNYINDLSSNITNDYNAKFGNVLRDYAVLQTAYNNYTSPDSYLGNLDNSYNNIKTTRSSLDNELLNLYNIQGTIPDIYKKQVDSSLYAGILWTVLATSLVYYVFIKL